MLDFNGAEEQRADGLIPDGTYCLLRANIIPGKYTLPESEPADTDLLTASKSSSAIMLNFEFTVLAGPYRGRKLWRYMVVAGGQVDDDGISKACKITQQTLRAMLESALGIDPKDQSERAVSARTINSFSDLDGLEFAAKIGIEPGGQYPDKNKISYVVVPGGEEYETVRAGGDVPPKPTSRPSSGGAAAPVQQSAFSWEAAPKSATAVHKPPLAAARSGPNWLKGQ